MGLESILQAIQSTGEAQINNINLEQKNKIAEILSKAAENSRELEKKEFEALLLLTKEQEALILQDAGLKAARIRDQAVDDFLQKIWEQVENSLKTIRQLSEYPEILRILVKEVLSEFEQTCLQDKDLIFECDPRDRESLKNIFSELNIQPETRITLNTWGGVVLTNLSGSLRIDNTLETRLNHAKEFLNSLFLKKIHLAEERI